MNSLTLSLKHVTKTQRQKPNGVDVSAPGKNPQAHAREMRRAGATLREIAKELKISHEWARTLCRGTEKGQRVKMVIAFDAHAESLKLLAINFPTHCGNLRKKLRKTQVELGRLLGVTGNPGVAVSRWESGRHVPQRKYLLRFMTLQNEYDNKPKPKSKRKRVV
jgi:DNA-binding transcriptional regulator YiaG